MPWVVSIKRQPAGFQLTCVRTSKTITPTDEPEEDKIITRFWRLHSHVRCCVNVVGTRCWRSRRPVTQWPARSVACSSNLPVVVHEHLIHFPETASDMWCSCGRMATGGLIHWLSQGSSGEMFRYIYWLVVFTTLGGHGKEKPAKCWTSKYKQGDTSNEESDGYTLIDTSISGLCYWSHSEATLN